jgi:hypothetical protein
MGDLQLCYLCLGPLRLGNFEKNPAKQCYPGLFWRQNTLERGSARCRHARATSAPAALPVHTSRGFVVPSGPCVIPSSLCVTSVGPLVGATWHIFMRGPAAPSYAIGRDAARTSPPPSAVPQPCHNPHRDIPHLDAQETPSPPHVRL